MLNDVKKRYLKGKAEAMMELTKDWKEINCEYLQDLAEKAKCHKTVHEKRCKNIIYELEGQDNILVIIQGDFSAISLNDRQIQEACGDEIITAKYTKSSEEQGRKRKRSCMKDGRLQFIHKMCVSEAERELQADHITTDRAFNTKETLRVCSAAQNSMNKKYRSRITTTKTGLSKFTCECRVDDLGSVSFDSEEFKGYKTDSIKANEKVIVTSRQFKDMDEMYCDINRVEKKLFGEYRYNPLLACETVFDELLLLELLFFGTLTEEEYKYAKIYALKKRSDPKGYDICKYYGLELEVV